MSRPRKPFGATHPGRLPATMMKVLAAEMSDPQRLRRGKQYARDGSVLDIVVEPGIVTCEVQGSRPTPYIASIEVTMGDGMPLRRDVTTTCTCPDDDNWDDYSCKHALAAMFAFSDELLLEPELLDVWRGRVAPEGAAGRDDAVDRGSGTEPAAAETGTGTGTATGPGTGTDSPSRRHLRLVGPDDRTHDRARDRTARRAPDDPGADRPLVDPLAAELAVPAGATLPDVPLLEPREPDLPRDTRLAAVLRDSLGHLRVDWD